MRYAFDVWGPHLLNGLGQDRHMVMSFCYWVLCRLLDLPVPRGPRQVGNEIALLVLRHEVVVLAGTSPGCDSARPIGRYSPRWRLLPGNGGPA